jgi:hypothetical protein
MDNRRWRMDDEMYWTLMLEVCLTYQHFIKKKEKKVKKRINVLFNYGYIRAYDTDYEYLRSVECNLSLGILAGKAGQCVA